MGISQPHSLDWLDAPRPDALAEAAKQLRLLDALTDEGHLTRLGREMASLPIEPRLSRALLRARELGCLDVAAAVAALVVGEELYCRAGSPQLVAAAEATRKRCVSNDGDFIAMLRLFDAWRQVGHHRRERWCESNGVHSRALRSADEVRLQLLAMLNRVGRGVPPHTAESHPAESHPAESHLDAERRCREAFCAGYYMHSARRLRGLNAFLTIAEPQQTVLPRAECALGAASGSELTSHLIFHELVWSGRLYMRHACAVEWKWLEPYIRNLSAVDIPRLLGAGTGTSCLQAEGWGRGGVGGGRGGEGAGSGGDTRESLSGGDGASQVESGGESGCGGCVSHEGSVRRNDKTRVAEAKQRLKARRDARALEEAARVKTQRGT